MSDAVFWFRLYHSCLDNSKTGNLPDHRFGQWIKLIILASRNNPRGILPHDKLLKKTLGGQFIHNPSRLILLKEYFIKTRLLDKLPDGTLQVHNFTSRQWLSVPFPQEHPQEHPQIVDVTLGDTRVDNKSFNPKSDTKNPGTESEEAFIGGWERLFLCFKDPISTIKKELYQLLVINKGSMDSRRSGARSLCGDIEPMPPSKRSITKESSQLQLLSTRRIEAAFSTLSTLWNSSEGIIHHKAFDKNDIEVTRRALIIFSAEQISTAIQRYSTWAIGAKSGKYRECYRWSYYEFMSRHKGVLIKRLCTEQWEDTCLPFSTGKQRPNKPVTVADLLARAEKAKGKG